MGACGGSVRNAAARRAASLCGLKTVTRASTARPMRSRIFIEESFQILHPLRIKNAFEVIHFVLYDTGVEALCCPRDLASIQVEPAIANVSWPLDETPQAGDGETTFPAALGLGIQHLNFRIDE